MIKPGIPSSPTDFDGFSLLIIIIIIIIVVFVKTERTSSLVRSTTCIWEIYGSNVGRNTAFVDENFSAFLQVVEMKARTFFGLSYEHFIHQYFQLTVHVHPCSSFDAMKERVLW
jgi:hypothetical protein